MKLALFLSLAIFGCAVFAVEYYTDAYDNTNVDSILRNDRLFKPYLGCLLDEGSCTADGRALKSILPDAMSNNCARCSDKQKALARQIGRYMTENRADSWALLVEKYDPDHQYAQKFQEFLAEE